MNVKKSDEFKREALQFAFTLFKMLDHYERSELQAAVVDARVAAFIETTLSSAINQSRRIK